MAIDIHARIRDNLHGSIEISSLENKIISHPAMQRLRRIKQTSFLYLAFPGATHSRFEHSLGVLHIATLLWKTLAENQQQLTNTLQLLPNYQEIEQPQRFKLLLPSDLQSKIFFDPYITQTLRLAALMHDVGHPPFSHNGESLLPSLSEILRHNPDLPIYLQEFLQQQMELKRKASHETFTVLLIDKIMCSINEKLPRDMPHIQPQDIASLICNEIQPTQGSLIEKYHINTLGQELLSSDLDIDRMDYLLRDSRECGVTYGVFDFMRIIGSLILYYDNEKKCMHLGLKHSGLAAYEDYLQARLLMYSQIYFHKTSVAAEAMLRNMTRKISYTIPSNLDRYVRLDEYNILSDLRCVSNGDAQLIIDDLFYRRNLWKRVFEAADGDSDKLIADVLHTVQSTKEEYEFMCYLCCIAKIPNKKQSSLKIIKKDREQIPQLEAIERHSRFYQQEHKIKLRRFYVTNQPKKIPYDELKKKILQCVRL